MKRLELITAYRLYRKMMRYPSLVEDMRIIFFKALEDRGITDKKSIEKEALLLLKEESPETATDLLKEYTNALVDLSFAKSFNETEIENHINLARKNDRFQNLYKVVNSEGATSSMIKKALYEFCAIPQGELFIDSIEAEGVRVALINFFISNQLPFISIAKKYITIRDSEEIIDHTLWDRRHPGKIGGKAAGLVLAHKILVPRLAKGEPELEKFIRIPETYYINSGIFSDFLDYNDLHRFYAQKYKNRDEIEEDYKTIAKVFQEGSFPPDVVEDLRAFLEKIGPHPIILRSSSLLEDNFGLAFSGKYDSIFLTNQGDFETRFQDFIWGLKQVDMSTYGPNPIMYRKVHNLLDFDEKMSILVQKVVGRKFGDYFFPFAAGVGFSYSSYSWTPRIRKEDGVVRLVFGLGTRAVDRVGDDYPRMIALSHPTLRSEVDAQQIGKYSQKTVDVLNLKKGRLESIPYIQLLKEIQHPDLHKLISIKEGDHLSAPRFKMSGVDIHKTCITFDNLITGSHFAPLMKKILHRLEEAYGRPVDVEFALDDGKLYLLQCRSLSIRREEAHITIPDDIPEERILFSNHQVVANSSVENIEYLVYVNPKEYARLATQEEKHIIGRIVSRLNRALEDKIFALLGPGRWGSNDINLGVRVDYEDIHFTKILGEIAFAEGGSTPEVSHGTHFFNDLVEAEILPVAIFPDENGTIFKESFFLDHLNILSSLLPEDKRYESVVRVIHIPESAEGHFLHIIQDSKNQEGIGFLDNAFNAEY